MRIPRGHLAVHVKRRDTTVTTDSNATPAAPTGEQAVNHSYNEFILQLPSHWKELPTVETDTLTFRSDIEQATITVNAEFYVIPEDKFDAIAAHCIDSRLDGLQQVRIDKVALLSRSIKPIEGGEGREVIFGAEIPGERIFLYLGYVTPKKVFNFTMACNPDRNAAAALFDKVIPNLQVKLP